MPTKLLTVVILFFALGRPAVYGQSMPESQGVAVVKSTLKSHILSEASWAMQQQPITITAQTSPRSAGGKHDFFSESDYFWPNPENLTGPYKEIDGKTNPENFLAHRKAMIRFSRIMGALGSAYKLTGDGKYVKQALAHCKAWFSDTATRMNPHLQYAQAVRNGVTGRSWGIIDTIHFMEVVQALVVMEKSKAADRQTLAATRHWFTQYINWLTTHENGRKEMEATNNHATCWVMQVAAFARFTGDTAMLNLCRERYKTILLGQMADDGSFPREMKRTKPYGYAIFNLDAMTMICQIASDRKDDLWSYQTADGKGIKKGISFLYPYLADKSSWPLKPDVMYWNDWPVAQPFLVFGALEFNQKEWLETWKKLDHDPQVEEVLRNLPVRNPVIWLD
ncbi:alginate lyase family protein [Spirosoma endbachense]|uniref:Alginate lyase n=1 Tax=Spirosoma endbachense TaxID=2666025 RepID=A0A6P1W862_9BACT|nr:alginate lyase family protein [Spirosoma endbachense]QHV99876.1 alginate lyase [Spirosoma endbachense]